MTRLYITILAVVLCGCSSAHDDQQVAEETLIVAQQNGLDYAATLAKAKTGDAQAVHTLLNFSDQVDAASALGHGVVLVDLAIVLTDERFALIVRDEPEIRRQTLQRLIEAGFAYHVEYAHGEFQKVLPETFTALTAR